MDNNRTDCPLVSVVVITYNSSKTVTETLDSIKAQPYQNIELIVSDDCSKDNTIDVVQQWLVKNGSRFVCTELVTAEHNTGVSGNLNRGIQKSHGEWIKSIAGDDLLVPSAIEEYIQFIQTNEEKVRMCVCDVELFSKEGEISESLLETYKTFFKYECESYEIQRKRVMTRLVFVGPTYFYSRDLFDEVGGYSEEYGNAEEWPFVYKVIRCGNRIYALDKQLIRYRVQATSLCHERNAVGKGNKKLFMEMYRHFFDHPFRDLIREGHVLQAWDTAIQYWSHRMQYHINNLMMRKVLHKLFLMLSPLAYLRKLNLISDDISVH